jgi:hypothetical protein
MIHGRYTTNDKKKQAMMISGVKEYKKNKYEMNEQGLIDVWSWASRRIVGWNPECVVMLRRWHSHDREFACR